jgi:hypothetical protein
MKTIEPGKFVVVSYTKKYDLSQTNYKYLIKVPDYDKATVEDALMKFAIEAGCLKDSEFFEITGVGFKEIKEGEYDI